MFLLDTNIISLLLRKNPQVIQKIEATSPSLIFTCTLVASELLFGAYRSPFKKDILLQFYSNFFKKVEIFDYDLSAAINFAKIKAYLSEKGMIIEDFDLMIASICLANDLVLVLIMPSIFKELRL